MKDISINDRVFFVKILSFEDICFAYVRVTDIKKDKFFIAPTNADVDVSVPVSKEFLFETKDEAAEYLMNASSTIATQFISNVAEVLTEIKYKNFENSKDVDESLSTSEYKS